MMNTMNNGMNNNGMGFDMNMFANMVAQAMMQNTQTPNCIPNNAVSTPADDANRGKYFGKTICGEVYNPRTARRWISAQYMRLVGSINRINDNINDVIRSYYNYDYAIRYTIKELKLLNYIKKNDPVAYEERKYFFTLKIVNGIFKDFASKYKKNLLEKIGKCYTYADYVNVADDILFVIDKRDFDDGIKYTEYKNGVTAYCGRCSTIRANLPKDFISAFKKSGAYYTLKNYIMFDPDFTLVWFNERPMMCDALATLKNALINNTYDFYFHKALMRSIEENAIDINNPFRHMN